jgi:Putative zinc-finger
MTDTDRLDRMRGYFHTGEIPIATPHCVDAETIGALAEGTLDAESRARALAHVAACVHCRRAVASVAEALADGPVTHEIDVVEGRARRPGRLLRVTVPLAAAAILLLLLWSPAGDEPAIHRGNGGTAPTPIAPVGAVAAAQRLDWTGMIGADRYRVTLFDARGDVLYETELTDTSAVLPSSVELIAGTPYLWRVEARTGWDRWTASELVRFTIARAPPP